MEIYSRKTMQGAWEISAVVENDYGTEYFINRQYFGYTKAEAIAKFKSEMPKVA